MREIVIALAVALLLCSPVTAVVDNTNPYYEVWLIGGQTYNERSEMFSYLIGGDIAEALSSIPSKRDESLTAAYTQAYESWCNGELTELTLSQIFAFDNYNKLGHFYITEEQSNFVSDYENLYHQYYVAYEDWAHDIEYNLISDSYPQLPPRVSMDIPSITPPPREMDKSGEYIYSLIHTVM